MSPKTTKKPRHYLRRAAAAGSKPSAPPETETGNKDILRKRKRRNKGGRPFEITPAKVRLLEDAFQYDFTLEEAWDYANVKKSTYYDRLKNDPVFSDRMRRAQSFPLTLAKKAVIGQIKGDAAKKIRPDGNLGLSLLKARQRDRYATKTENEIPQLPPITINLPGGKAHTRFTPEKQ